MAASEQHGSTSVPATKLRSPELPGSVVDRDRLLQVLADEPRPVTLICGPAGAGKTTLLASWFAVHAGSDVAVAWLDLDRHDNDAVLLWNAVLAALRTSGAFGANDRIHALQAPQAGADAAFLGELLAALERLEQPLWLVLDDVHELTEAAALASLELLLQRQPTSLRVVLSSRNDPPLGLQRLRLAGRLREIRMEDLAFTREESAELLLRHAVTLDVGIMDQLLHRTEGWAAGLQIAALALADDPDPDGFMRRFDGTDRSVADYLVAEVLRHRSPETRRLLHETSTCESIGLDLAEHLTERHDVGEALDGLARENVVTVLAGAHQPVYRYHELLRSYLQAELRRTDRLAYVRLHQLSSRWYDARADGAHALEHAVLASDGELTLGLLRRYGIGLLLDGQGARLQRLLDSLDPPALHAPVVPLLRGAVALHRLGFGGSDDAVLPNVGALSTQDDPWLTALHATVDLHRARLTGAPSGALAHAGTTAAGKTGDLDLDLLALQHLGTSRIWSGEYRAAADDLERAVAMATARGRDAIAVSCLSGLSGAASGMSDFTAMRKHADRALALAAERGWSRSPIAANAHVSRAACSYLQADPEDAWEHAVLAMEALGTHIDAPIELSARCAQAFLEVERGGSPLHALHAIRTAWADAARREIGPALHAFAIPMEIRLCLGTGQTEWATEAAQRTLRRFAGTAEAALVSALLLSGRGQAHAARTTITPILRGELPVLVSLTQVSAWLLEAELAAALQLDHYAFDALVTSLRLAEPDDLVRPFLDAGAPIHALLLANAGRYGWSEGFATRILELHPAPGRSTNPLTPAETNLLQDLPSVHTFSEIAQSRQVSLNTVKTHARAIYTKLGVGSRREAVREARRRGLL